MAKPRVNVCPVANGYSGPAERIIEFSSGNDTVQAGGLISLRRTDAGTLDVQLYQQDPTVRVSVSGAGFLATGLLGTCVHCGQPIGQAADQRWFSDGPDFACANADAGAHQSEPR